MTAANTPQPGDTLVPSAPAERRRIVRSDAFGSLAYAIGAGLFIILAIAIVLSAR